MKTKRSSDAVLIAALGEELRNAAKNYCALRSEVEGKRWASRMHRSINLYGPVEAACRSVKQSTGATLTWLKEHDALYLSTERIVIKSKYKRIIPKDIDLRARGNLVEIEFGAAEGK